MTRERVGVLIVRAWIEDPGPPFRARLTESMDVVSGTWNSQPVGSVDDVVVIVREWLDEFVEADAEVRGRSTHTG